ncbi:leucyl/phenylalanyl-tRNA--protein transferase [Parerythrobacter jejuensis]|uniref:Leucyl/phenylalanyl-tRNA--protein transferase n=1 Tax=Parerythrobacter jejuensis TaxID=795812 RepID=A0A845AR30_9SPHN|nr:leucyl/phenylalanyl-tRNA--protein transferase [Parerythrobacter jejuensis]MXP31345.1 leucyl/phenylalanyl-tRNA--protein transferase [Parerythrobacter jejuensis]MXP34105.1 leucyl/phenylalanyl-tRNA--protein transferase [Parerythrobacter jejuensis]
MHAPRPQSSSATIPADLLLLAYRNGIFPMADSRKDQEIFWVEPRERATIPIGGFRMSRSLARTIRQDRFSVTCDRAFDEVVEGCAEPRPDHPESWISQRIAASYAALHKAGHAHSIECWDGNNLVGGVYGVSFDKVFCGESMFSRRRDASKVALAWLLALLERAGCELFDCQFMTDHLASLGAVAMSQSDYLARVAAASGPQPLSLPEAYASLSEEVSLAGADGSPGKRIAHSLTQTS